MELKSPETPHPWESWHMPSPLQKCGNLDTSNSNLTQPCGWGGGPGVVALATREQSAPIVPKARLLHVESAHNLQSPGVPSHTQVREPQSAMRCQEQPPVQGFMESPQCNGGHEPEWPTPEIREKGANAAWSLDKWRSSSGRNHL